MKHKWLKFYIMFYKFSPSLSLYYLTKRRKRNVEEQKKYIVNFTVFATHHLLVQNPNFQDGSNYGIYFCNTARDNSTLTSFRYLLKYLLFKEDFPTTLYKRALPYRYLSYSPFFYTSWLSTIRYIMHLLIYL